MCVLERVAGAEDRGARLDRFVATAVADLSRTRAARLIRGGRVSVNGSAAEPDQRLAPGDRVLVRIPPETEALVPDEAPLEVALETPEFAAINKPSGLTMHPGVGREAGTLAHRLVARYPEAKAVGHPRRPGIVHRLDKDTSGIVLIARTVRAYAHLTREFAERRVVKRYLLLAHGQPVPPQGRIEAPIGRHPSQRTRMAVRRRGRSAETTYSVLGRAAAVSLVLAQPSSGRTHQIRVHMATIGYPIWGDARYGPRPARAPRAMLHAWTLEFVGPDATPWRVAAPPPADFLLQAEEQGLTLPATPCSESR